MWKFFKNKFWIKARIIISFSIFTILTVNIFVYLLYIFVEKDFVKNTHKDINYEFQTITTFIDLQKSNIFSLPEKEIKKINSLNFFFYIWNNDENLKKNYKLWFSESENKIIFRWDYKNHNIIIWKKINDLKNIQKNFIEISILLNILTIFFTIIFSYFITLTSLKPLSKISNFLDKYDINKEQKEIKNLYWNSEIWIFIQNINIFFSKIKNIFESQKYFIQDVSHELKTPLMQIESTLEILENKIEKKENLEKIENIKSITENINNIISKLWFILRWEEFLAKKEKINLWNYLEKILENYKNSAKEKNIKIILEKKSEIFLENNEYYLERLFWNLISNAIFYNNWNNKIKIILDKNSNKKNFVEIKDEWIWIKKENLDKIFNRFYRDSNSWVFYKNWNWLGLNIVQKIYNMFWWKIEIESEIWKWTDFKIIF